MWVDGVLDSEKLKELKQEPGFQRIEQGEKYAIVFFSLRPKRQGFRYLDPNKFVVQIDAQCNELEINFNPTPEQVEQLREFKNRLKKLSQSPLSIR